MWAFELPERSYSLSTKILGHLERLAGCLAPDETWGKGVHHAGLNWGDCFAFEVAKEYGCRLLFVGDDFSKTDIEDVI
jgi:uncharacterized protein with PIN domain